MREYIPIGYHPVLKLYSIKHVKTGEVKMVNKEDFDYYVSQAKRSKDKSHP